MNILSVKDLFTTLSNLLIDLSKVNQITPNISRIYSLRKSYKFIVMLYKNKSLSSAQLLKILQCLIWVMSENLISLTCWRELRKSRVNSLLSWYTNSRTLDILWGVNVHKFTACLALSKSIFVNVRKLVMLSNVIILYKGFWKEAEIWSKIADTLLETKKTNSTEEKIDLWF